MRDPGTGLEELLGRLSGMWKRMEVMFRGERQAKVEKPEWRMLKRKKRLCRDVMS